MTELKPRSAWTSSQPGGAEYDPDRYRGIAIHWPASTGSYAGVTDAQAIATLNAWRKYHMDKPPAGHGWSDLAYQYAVTDDGTIWTCRGMHHMSAANGDTGPNSAFGAVILFLGPRDPVTPAMEEAVCWLRAQYMLAGTGPEVLTHNQVRRLFGLDGTECPGPAATAAVARGDFSHPPGQQEEEDDMFTEADRQQLAITRGKVELTYNQVNAVGAAVIASDKATEAESVEQIKAAIALAFEGLKDDDVPGDISADELADLIIIKLGAAITAGAPDAPPPPP